MSTDKEALQIFELSPDLIGMGNLEGFFTRINSAFGRLLGYSDQEFLSKPFLAFVHDDDFSRTAQALSEAVEGKQLLLVENRYRCKDGSYKWIDWRVRVDSSDKRFYAVGRDVTQQKEAENRLKRAIDKADRANRAKSEFLANMSHEIRTPLSGMVTMTKVLQDTNLDARQSKFASAILLSAETLVQILDDILDLTKFESGHIKISDNNFSLEALLAHCGSLFQPLAEAKNLVFRMEKALQGHDRVRGDKIRVYQVIANLISNAIKFTERGSVNCRVSLEEQEGMGCLLKVSVQDTGPGISPAQHEHIFDRFTQLSGGFSKRYAGTGLGLTVSKSLVELMQGRIGLESVPGKGSCFHFELPLRKAEKDAGERVPQTLYEAIEGRHVLIVDDDSISRLGARLLLEQEGFRVSEAEGGMIALDMLSKQAFDAVLMDVHMPNMDGLEVTRRIRRADDPAVSQLLVIGLTASVLNGERERYLAAGMDSVLAKPINVEEVCSEMASFNNKS
jgi:PAS domain S-box-containing protein